MLQKSAFVEAQWCFICVRLLGKLSPGRWPAIAEPHRMYTSMRLNFHGPDPGPDHITTVALYLFKVK